MKLLLCDLRKECVDALQQRFAGQAGVRVQQKSITKTRSACWASAGNSFGDMGGGIDKAIDDYFQGEAQKQVQSEIAASYFGELPVGSALLLKPKPRKPSLIYAPSMRVPGRLGPSIHPYLAMRAILSTALKASIPSLSCPLIGTGVGGMEPLDAAEQLFQAYRLIMLGEWKEVKHSVQAPYVMR